MHICIITFLGISKDSPAWGGVHTHTKNLVELLIASGHSVSMITGEGENFESDHLFIRRVEVLKEQKDEKLWFKNAQNVFLGIHRKNHVECVFSQGGGVRGLMDLMDDLHLPVITFVHSLSMHYFFNKWQEVDGFRSLKSYVFRTLPTIVHNIFINDIKFLKRCKIVVSGSSRIGKHLERYYLIPQKKVRVVNNWINPDIFKYNESSRHKIRNDIGIVNEDVVFLLVGSVWKPKGFRNAIKAFRQVIYQIPKAYLVIAGKGPDREYIEKYIRNSDTMRKRVLFLGQYPHKELPGLFSAADIFIIPSLMNEVLPYTLLEAMSCELPIIATDIFANREALGGNGHFVPRGDKESLTNAMFYFASNLSNKRSDATLNRKRVIDHFSNEVAIKKINTLLSEITD